MDTTLNTNRSLNMFNEEEASLLNLSRDVDGLITDLRKNVLDAVQGIRQRINAQCMDLLENERNERREHERRLLAQIENLQFVLREKDAELDKLRLINDRLIQRSKSQHTGEAATRKLAKEALRQWHQHVVQTKYRKRLGEHLSQVRQEREIRQAFTSWRLEAQRVKYEEAKEKMEGEHRRTVTKLTNEHHSAENKMQLEMLAMKDQLSKEEEHRAILEERLKAAFMRGVCALNMEAMSVLKNTGDAGADTMSVASLLQNMNLTAGIDTTTFSADAGHNERLLRQQQELQEHLNRFEVPPQPDDAPPLPVLRPLAASASYNRLAQTSAPTQGGHNPVVQLNPNYPGSRPQSAVSQSSKPIAARGVTNNLPVSGRGRWRQ
jgi:hypothetical protein